MHVHLINIKMRLQNKKSEILKNNHRNAANGCLVKDKTNERKTTEVNNKLANHKVNGSRTKLKSNGGLAINVDKQRGVKDHQRPGYINKSEKTKAKLGANVSAEHSTIREGDSLGALIIDNHAKSNGLTEEVPSTPSPKLPKKQNSILEQLQDSKSNRALQRINPEQSYKNSRLRSTTTGNKISNKQTVDEKSHSKSPRENNYQTKNKTEKTSTVIENKEVPIHYNNCNKKTKIKLPASEPNGYVRRSHAQEFPGVMEILDEAKNDEGIKSDSLSEVSEAPTTDNDTNGRISPTELKPNDESCRKKSVSEKQEQSMMKSPVKENKSSKDSPIAAYIKNIVQDPPHADNDRMKMMASPRHTPIPCKNHPGKNPEDVLEAVLFCGLCRESVCYKCAFERHKEHDVSPIPTAAENIRVKLADNKRKIEANISHLRSQRKAAEASSDELAKRMQVQFSAVMERIREKEQEVLVALENARQQSLNAVYKLQTQQETSWNQIDAVLKTNEDGKMLQEYTMLDAATTSLEFSPCTSTDSGCMSPSLVSPRATLDLHDLQAEIEKISLQCAQSNVKIADGNKRPNGGIAVVGDVYNKSHKYFFKLDPSSANPALRVSGNGSCVEYVGCERNKTFKISHKYTTSSGASSKAPRLSPNHPLLQGASLNKWRKSQFANVLADIPITQGKQYWEISVNRSMEYKLGVSYKHIQGTKTLPDEHNSWMLSLSYPDRFSAMHKGRKEYIFISGHATLRNIKVLRIGLFLDYERGILSFYNATNSSEKRHLYTFRTFFNRPVWPIVSLRQGKLQVISGIPVPRNLVWKTR